jgi:hypothetical protein
MHRRSLLAGLLAATTTVAAVGGLLAPAAQAAAPASTSASTKTAKAGTRVAITIQGEPITRVDRTPEYSVIITGLDDKTKARVNFGDGTTTVKAKGTCSVAKAKRTPNSCGIRVRHVYDKPGDFTISAAAGKKRVSQGVSIAAKPQAWRPTPGQQFTSWAPLGSQATYTPCQTVTWYFDTTGQPADRSGMRDDILASLNKLSGLTKLTFTEIDDPRAADLTFSWRDLAELGYADASGVGGFDGPSRGWVAFSPTNEWTNDYWAGDQPKTKRWQEGNWIYTLNINGRQTLVTHEIMHAMGFAHVEDFTSIMYPQSIGNGAGQLSAGDLEGLSTMYGSLPCPAIPD